MEKHFDIGLLQAIAEGKVRVGDKIKIPGSSNCWGSGDGFYKIKEYSTDSSSVINDHTGCSCNDLKKPFILERQPITWETLMEGDVLIAEGGKELTILGRQNSILFLSRHNRPTSYSGGFTIEDCIAEGYSIKNTTEEEVQEMTVEEISKLVGKTVKVVEKK